MAQMRTQTFLYPTLVPSREKQAVLDAAGRCESCDAVDLAAARGELEVAMERFVNSLPDHPDPDWNLGVMSSIAASSIGKYEDALAFSEESLKSASNDRQLAISHNNLSHDNRRLGRFELAEAHACRASELWPTHAGFACNLALAYARTGKIDAAAAIILQLAEDEENAGKGARGILSAHVRFEEDMMELVNAIEVACAT